MPNLNIFDNAVPSIIPPGMGQKPKASWGWSEKRKAKWLRRHPLVQNSLATTMVPARIDDVATAAPRPQRSGSNFAPRQIRVVEATRRPFLP